MRSSPRTHLGRGERCRRNKAAHLARLQRGNGRLAHGTLDACGVVRALTLEVRVVVISSDSGEAHLPFNERYRLAFVQSPGASDNVQLRYQVSCPPRSCRRQVPPVQSAFGRQRSGSGNCRSSSVHHHLFNRMGDLVETVSGPRRAPKNRARSFRLG